MEQKKYRNRAEDARIPSIDQLLEAALFIGVALLVLSQFF